MRIPNPARFAAAMGRALWAFLRGDKVLVPPEVELERVAKCERCPLFDPEARQCTVCTCFVDLKCAVATEKCPRGKWKRFWGCAH